MREKLPWILLALVALVLRLWDLQGRPLHHDESLHAFYSYEFARFGVYKYVPFLHGPLLYFLTALNFVVCRTTNDFLARLPAAFAGVALTVIPYYLRHWLGHRVALLTGFGIALSPTLLYFSRFLRHDIYSALLHAIALVALLRFQEGKQRRWFLTAVAALMLSFVNHELTYISLFLIGCFSTLILWRQGWVIGPLWHRYRHLLWPSILTAATIYTLFFTTFFTNLKGFMDGLPNPFSSNTSLGYWLSQHGVKRGNQPIYYYALCLLTYEFVVGALFVGSIFGLRRRMAQPLVRFLTFWSVGAFAIYSWAGERMPWLLMHSLLPMIPLAAMQADHLWQNHRRLFFCLVLPLVAFNIWVSLRLNFSLHTDPRELMVYVQSSADVLKVRDRITDFETKSGRRAKLVIDNELTWPFAWYLRRSEIIGYPNKLYQSINERELNADFILIHLPDQERRIASPAPFVEIACFSLRDWWVPNHRTMNVTSWRGFENLMGWWWSRRLDDGSAAGQGSLQFCLFGREPQS